MATDVIDVENSNLVLIRTMSDTVETDIRRVYEVCNEALELFQKTQLSFEELRRIADGPLDLFMIPLAFPEKCESDPDIIYDESLRKDLRDILIGAAKKRGYDQNPPDLVPGIEGSLRTTRDMGIKNYLLTTSGGRFRHKATQRLAKYFDGIINRSQTYYRKEQGIYHLLSETKLEPDQVVILTGTASYIRAARHLGVHTVSLAWEYAYNDETTLRSAKPEEVIHDLQELPVILESYFKG